VYHPYMRVACICYVRPLDGNLDFVVYVRVYASVQDNQIRMLFRLATRCVCIDVSRTSV
jgi:hypothetical protein